MVRWVVGSIPTGGPIELFLMFGPVLHNRCNKNRSMYYPVRVMVYVKDTLLLKGKSSPSSGGSGFPNQMVLNHMFDSI